MVMKPDRSACQVSNVCGDASQHLTFRVNYEVIVLAGLKSRRSRLELYLTVLKAIKNGTEKPTRIMYEANLSWTSLKGILFALVSQDLVEEIDVSEPRDKRTNKVYRVTMKGDRLIRYFHHAEQLLEFD